MDKKQFDYIENRIREAAENSEPAFDESAWVKMEARLNDEGNRRYRFLWWWFSLLLLFIGGSAYFILNNKHVEKIAKYQKDKTVTVDKSEQQKQKNVSTETTTPVNSRANANKKAGQDEKVGPEISQEVKQSYDKYIDAEKEIVYHSLKKIQHTNKGKLSSKIHSPEIDATDETVSVVNKDDNMLNQEPVKENPENKIVENVSDTIIKVDSSKTIVAKNIVDSNTKNKIKQASISKFYFLASVGAEVTGVKLLSFQDNPISAKYGIGIGYQLNKKVSIQTGFYSGMKKYIAGPEDYNPTRKRISGDTLVKVDASCLVYDIPVTIRYNFVQKSTTVFYATAGLSSFIMKKEDYNFYLIDTSNRSYEKSIPYTGNSNFFSVFNFSVGMEKRLSPNFSILAEPSVSIPLSGVGWGRVKLYSAALQAGIKYIPHRKHK